VCVCGDRTRATAKLKHKNVTFALQQKHATIHVSGAESPDSCPVTRSATLQRLSDSITFYSKQECRMAFRHWTFYLTFSQGNNLSNFRRELPDTV
jgi:hypothetical protein